MMQNIFRRTLIALSCSSVLLLSACGGGSDGGNDSNNGGSNNNTLFQSETNYTAGSLSEASSIKVMTYLMPNVVGNTAKATAMVMFPKTTQPIDGWRVVVWSHGTTGVGDSCAPSKNPLNPRFEILANSLLKAGYVIVAPDYEGLGTAGIHPYLNLSSEANSGLYALKAAQEKYNQQLNKAWMSVGQSQGGHASLGVAEYADGSADFKGAVAAAPAANLTYIITQIAPIAIKQLEQAEKAGAYPAGTSVAVYAELLAYAAYTGVGIRAYNSQFNLGSIFEDGAKLIAEKAEGTTGENGLCLTPLTTEFATAISSYLSTHPNGSVLDYPGLKAGFENEADIVNFVLKNQPATKKFNKPIYVVQGKLDEAVPYQITQNWVDYSNNTLGSNPQVVLDLVEGATHTQAIVQRNDQVVAFIQKNMPIQ